MLLRRKLSYYVLYVTFRKAEASLLCTVGNLASQASLFVCFVGLQRLGQGLESGFGQGFGMRIYLPFWYVGCQMRL